MTLECPIPLSEYPHVVLPHGGGGRLMHQLIEKMFLECFKHPSLAARHDGAVLPVSGKRIAFATDSYVVRPLFFPGGDIGTLAVNGTVNDLAMCGARPSFLSLGLIIEEGLLMADLWKIILSIADAATRAKVDVVTGDTKVVEHGKGDGLFINTAGVGILSDGVRIDPYQIRDGDVLILSGDIGRHGTAILAARGEVVFDEPLESDCAPLNHVVEALLEAKVEPHCMRDLTRGGLATALVELSSAAGVSIRIEEVQVPVRDEVQSACEVFGLDPLYVANEGRFILAVAPSEALKTLEVLQSRSDTAGATQIGTVSATGRGQVVMTTRYGTNRVIDMLSGEQLPRIC